MGLESTLRDVRAMLALVFAGADELPFRLAEQAFGDGAPWTPLAAGDTRLSGRIDRIDQSADGHKLRVIDYKTSLPRMDGTQLQPWLYAHKAASELGATEVEFSYLGLEKRNPRLRVVYSGTARSDAIDEALSRAARVARELSQGSVAARPSSPAHCPRCDARDICRRPLSAPAPEADD
jgi:RecB family exonuclease